jgi:hypothetical protein
MFIHLRDWRLRIPRPLIPSNPNKLNLLATIRGPTGFGSDCAVTTAKVARCPRRCRLLETEKLEAVANHEFDSRSPLESNDAALGRFLALFPGAKPAHIPIRVGLTSKTDGASERTTIEYRGSDTAIFSLTFPLYGVDAVRLRPPGGQRDASAAVVALMPNGRGFAVAVRFLEEVPRWLSKA